MSTVRLYHADSFLRDFTGRVVAHGVWRGRPSVILDRTAFYPEAGGQLADRGTLAGVPVVDVQVDDDDTVARTPRLLDARLGDAHDVLRPTLGVDGNVELLAERLELVDGRGTIHVARHQTSRTVLAFEAPRELGGGRRLAGTLQSDHHDHGRRDGAELESLATLAEHGRELVVDDLDELLAGRDGAQLRDAHGLFLDALEELAGELKVDVGLEQDAAHLAEAFFDVGFGEDAAAAEARKGRFEFFGQLVEHRLGKIDQPQA